jgi:DNA-binding CsgD family transcriptional regulator
MGNPTSLDHSCLIDCMIGTALDGMCVGLVILSEAGKVSWLNRAAEDLLGVSRSEATDQLLTHVLRDPQFSAFWHEAQQTEGTVMGEVSLHWPRRGELKVNATHCRAADGSALGRALLFCDVTAERTVALNLSQEATRRLLDMTEGHHAPSPAPIEGLTAQELRILRHVGEGLGNAEIGEHMHISPSTVRSHLKHLYAKLGLGSRAEAISYAIQNGLTG